MASRYSLDWVFQDEIKAEEFLPEEDERSVKADDEQVKCAVCLEVYKDPQLLPCLHSFCKNCVTVGLVDSATKSCPLCRGQYTLADIIPNTVLADKVASLKPQPNKCAQCDSSQVVIFCTNCNGYLCQQCEGAHKKLNIFKTHTSLLPLSQAKVKSKSKEYKCPKHSDELMRVYCIKCQVVICRDCALYSHHGHQFKPAEQAANEVKRKLKSSVSSATKQLETFQTHSQSIAKVEEHVTSYPDKLKTFITLKFDGLKQELENRKQALLREVDTQYDSFSKVLFAEKNSVDTTVGHLEAAIKFANAIDKCSNKLEVSVLGIQACASFKRLNSATWDPKPVQKLGPLVYLRRKSTERRNPASIPDESQYISSIGHLVNRESVLDTCVLTQVDYSSVFTQAYIDYSSMNLGSVSKKGYIPDTYEFINNGRVTLQVHSNEIAARGGIDVLFPEGTVSSEVSCDNTVIPSNVQLQSNGILSVTFSTPKAGKYSVKIGGIYIGTGQILSHCINFTYPKLPVPFPYDLMDSDFISCTSIDDTIFTEDSKVTSYKEPCKKSESPSSEEHCKKSELLSSIHDFLFPTKCLSSTKTMPPPPPTQYKQIKHLY